MTISIISLFITISSFTLRYIPSQNLSYGVQSLQDNSLPVFDPVTGVVSFDPAFYLTLTVINRGNQPATVSLIELYIKSLRLPSHNNNDCISSVSDRHQLYLFEDTSYDPNKMRGTSTSGDYGRKIVPAFTVLPRSTASDQHRFSLFDQERDLQEGTLSGLLCVDVGVTTTYGEFYHTVEALVQINVRKGEHLNPGSNINRLNSPYFGYKVQDNSPDIEGLQGKILVRKLYRNWLSYINFDWLGR